MERVGIVIRRRAFVFALTTAFLFGVLASGPEAGATAPPSGGPAANGEQRGQHVVLLPGDRVLAGTVEQIMGDMIKVNTGEVEPRYLSVKEAAEKGLPPLKRGDRLEIAVNDHNLVIDYRLFGQETWQRIVKGQLAQPLPVGHEWAVIQTKEGKSEAFAVRPLARSKVSAIPLHTDAIFLLDQTNKIVDATIGSEQVLQQTAKAWQKSPPKHTYQRIEGMIAKPMSWVTVKTLEGKERQFEVRPFVQDKLAKLPSGEHVILLIDDDNKVADVAFPRQATPAVGG